MRSKPRTSRNRGFVPTYSAMNIACSSATEPLPAEHRRHVLTRMWEAFASLRTAPAPDIRDWDAIADCVNMMATIVRLGWAEDSGLLGDAEEAIKKAAIRWHERGHFRFDAAGIKAVSAILEDYETVLNSASERNMRYAHNETERAIWETKRGRRVEGVMVVEV